MKKQQTEKQKKEMIQEHFFYEVINLLNIEILNRVNWLDETSKQISINISVDNILLHSRNLFEFFYDEKAKKTNFAYANQFISNWKELKPNKTEQIKQMQKRVNNECSHLTYNRFISIEHKSWNLYQLKMDFLKVTKIFLDNLSPEFFNERLKNFQNQLDKLLQDNKQI